jgi:hypothetical protein
VPEKASGFFPGNDVRSLRGNKHDGDKTRPSIRPVRNWQNMKSRMGVRPRRNRHKPVLGLIPEMTLFDDEEVQGRGSWRDGQRQENLA